MSDTMSDVEWDEMSDTMSDAAWDMTSDTMSDVVTDVASDVALILPYTPPPLSSFWNSREVANSCHEIRTHSSICVGSPESLTLVTATTNRAISRRTCK